MMIFFHLKSTVVHNHKKCVFVQHILDLTVFKKNVPAFKSVYDSIIYICFCLLLNALTIYLLELFH